jgi:hypothetical protein
MLQKRLLAVWDTVLLGEKNAVGVEQVQDGNKCTVLRLTKAPEDVTVGISNCLALLHGHTQRQFILVLVDELLKLEHHTCTRGHGRVAPLGEGSLGS